MNKCKNCNQKLENIGYENGYNIYQCPKCDNIKKDEE